MKSSKIWDFWANHYESLWVQKWSLKPTREAVVEELKKIYPKEKIFTLLDVGCGVGELLAEIQAAFPRVKVYGLDYSLRMTEKTKQRVPEGVICHRAVEELETINKTVFPETFDVILCTHSFPYYKDQGKVMNLFYRRLKPHGRLLLAFASESTFYDRRIMPLVKLTTGNAKYSSKEALRCMAKEQFIYEKEENVAKHFWMPTLLFAVLQKSWKVENDQLKELHHSAKAKINSLDHYKNNGHKEVQG